MYTQIIVGAAMRHSGAGLAIPDFPLMFGGIVPDHWNGAIAIHFTHRVGALMVAAAIAATSAHIWYHHRGRRGLTRPALLLIGLVIVQITLGALTVLSRRDVAINSTHVVCGALVLATSLVITLRAWRVRVRRGPAEAGHDECTANERGVRLQPDRRRARRQARVKNAQLEAAPATFQAGRRAADYVALAKPRLNVLVVASSAAGYYLGSPAAPELTPMLLAVCGTALVAGGAAVLNQVYERDTDALMQRTRLRPLPDHRVKAEEARVFGVVLSVAGTAILALAANLLAALVAAGHARHLPRGLHAVEAPVGDLDAGRRRARRTSAAHWMDGRTRRD